MILGGKGRDALATSRADRRQADRAATSAASRVSPSRLYPTPLLAAFRVLPAEQRMEALALLEGRLVAPLTFRQYVDRVHPEYLWAPHLVALARVLQDVADGLRTRVMCFMPPRHGKSEQISRLFTAYYLYRHPGLNVALTTYGAELSYELSRDARNNFLAVGGQLAGDANAVKSWSTTAGGKLWATGVGGPATGRGFNCFPAGTLVATERGAMDIATLVHLQDRPRVLSFSHDRRRTEWQRVVAAAVQPAVEFVDVTMLSGRRFRCTPEHRVYTQGHGYRAAGDLLPGDTLIAAQVPDAPGVRGVPRSCPAHADLPRVLRSLANGAVSAALRDVRDGVHARAVQRGETSAEGIRRPLLRHALRKGASRHEEPSSVSRVWFPDANEDRTTLCAVPADDEVGTHTSGRDVRSLRRPLPANVAPHPVLFAGVQERCARATDDRRGEQSLPHRAELREVVPRDASAHSRAGRPRVRGMQQDRYPDRVQRPDVTLLPAHAPHQPEPRRQCGGELGDALLCVPSSPSSLAPDWETDTVSAVVRSRTDAEPVYDIQVEGNSNFFADQVLVHNCGIVDDPYKDHTEAGSSIVRRSRLNWYRSVFRTRAAPGAAIVILLTRWHQADLVGELLKEEDVTRQGWHVLEMPAEKYTGPRPQGGDDDGPSSIRPHVWPATITLEPDARDDARWLWVDRFTADEYENIKRGLGGAGGYFWTALYQQRPTAMEGGLFKEAWFKRIPRGQLPRRMIGRIRRWDLAATDNDGAFTAGLRVEKDEQQNYYITALQHGQWEAGKRDVIIAQTARADGIGVLQGFPLDPAAAGKQVAAQFPRLLDGIAPVLIMPESGSKFLRLTMPASAASNGMLYIVDEPWAAVVITELCAAGEGAEYWDIADALSGAFTYLAPLSATDTDARSHSLRSTR